jgi:FAD-dependent oxidoreductase domain-containing protein 1
VYNPRVLLVTIESWERRGGVQHMKASDVLIIGGGIVGSAIAYYLKQQAPGTTVLVVERDPGYRGSCTARSASAIRQQFNLALNVALSRFTYEFFKDATRHLSVNGEEVDLQFTDCPYLVLAAPEGVSRLASAHARQLAAGARIEFLDADRLAATIPWVKMEGIGAGCLGLAGEGWFDPMRALQALVRKTRALGAEYLTARVEAIERDGAQIRHVRTADGTVLRAGTVINAAGAQAGRVAALAGLDLPIESRKRSAFVFRAQHPPRGFTNLIDPTFSHHGVYARPYGSDFLAMTAPDPSQDPDTDDATVDQHLFTDVIRPALARRVRGFEDVELVDSWAGHYEMNCFDQNAILGPHPEVPTFILACGLSGHGVMHSAAIGRGIAERLLTGKYQSLDLTAFGYERILQNRPLDDVQASEHRDVATGV